MEISSYKIALIGAGNLAWSLIPNLQQAGANVIQLISRNDTFLNLYKAEFNISQISQNPSDIDPTVNLVFLTVGDQAVETVAEELKDSLPKNAVAVHTSGSTPIEKLSPFGERKGVFYPLQSFTRNKVSDFREVPLFLEGNNRVVNFLKPLAEALSNRVYELDSEKRKKLHLGAVWVNNFTNLMYRIASGLNEEMDFSVYQPLIMGHLEKVFELGPQETQTGPAIRGDLNTMNFHLNLLEKDADFHDLYLRLSRLINPKLPL